MNSCEIVEIKKCQINCSVRYTVYNFCEMVFKVNISMIFIILAPLDLRNVFSENLNHIVGMHWKPTIKNNFVPIRDFHNLELSFAARVISPLEQV